MLPLSEFQAALVVGIDSLLEKDAHTVEMRPKICTSGGEAQRCRGRFSTRLLGESSGPLWQSMLLVISKLKIKKKKKEREKERKRKKREAVVAVVAVVT